MTKRERKQQHVAASVTLKDKKGHSDIYDIIQTETEIYIDRDRDRGERMRTRAKKIERKKERKETTLDYKKTQL